MRRKWLGLIAATAVGAGVACGNEIPSYAPCKPSDECAEGTSCFGVSLTDTGGGGEPMRAREGNACTRLCGADSDCPGNGACYALEGDERETFICFERCEDASYCWQGFDCLRALVIDPMTGGTMESGGICVPLPIES